MESCKFLFIYPDINEYDSAYDDNQGAYSYGIAQLSSILKSQGVEIGLLHYTRRPSREKLLSDLASFAPDIIGFSANTMTIAEVYEWAKWIKEAGHSMPLVIGGTHASLDYKMVAASGLFEVIFIGESEESIVEYCKRYRERPTDILNTVAWNGDSYIYNPLRQLEQNLDKFPLPDWELFDYENLYDLKTHQRGILMASRGCPFCCSFCSNDRYIRMYRDKGKFVRLNSVDYIIREAKAMKTRYPAIRYFQFNDDILGYDLAWLKEFSQKWPKEVGLDYYGNLSANGCNDETIKLLAGSGCRRLQIGVETGNEARRKEILNKSILNKTLEKVVNQCHKYGIAVNCLNMIGLPLETEKNILETVHFNAKLRPQLLQCTIYYPFPHTRLYDYCLEHKLFKKEKVSRTDFLSKTNLINPRLSLKALYFYRDNFKTLVKLYQYINLDWLIKFFGYDLAGVIIRLFRTRNELNKWLYRPREESKKNLMVEADLNKIFF